MDHTYLRYECADAFGVTTASSSSKAPQSNSILGFLSRKANEPPVVLTTAGSQCIGFHLRTTLPTIKLGHRELLSGGVGTGRALNSDQVVCLDILFTTECIKVATGWVDGAVRIFDVQHHETNQGNGLVHSLIETNNYNSSNLDSDFTMREPLLLNGHSGTPVRTVSFCETTSSRLASGGSDGTIILWDIIAETGLFRLLGHRGAITDLHLVSLSSSLDVLISTSLDGLVKVWDLNGQYCTQTIPTHRGEVWSAACHSIPDNFHEKTRIRLLTGSTDGEVRVWNVDTPQRNKDVTNNDIDNSNKDNDTKTNNNNNNNKNNQQDKTNDNNDLDAICHYMGTLTPPPNVSTSSERISCIHYHPNGKYVGVLHNNSKNVNVYLIRNIKESIKKKQRRLKRRKEKKSKVENSTKDDNKTKGRKRGMLDDPEDDINNNDDDDEEYNNENQSSMLDQELNPELIKASDEFEYFGTIRASHKLKGFVFVPFKEPGSGIRIVCALSTNALEVHSLKRQNQSDKKTSSSSIVVADKVSTINMYGHPTGIRAVELSSDDGLACTVSKNITKIWNVANRSCIQSIAPIVKTTACYGLCATFLPGNAHVALGTREGHLLLLDIAAGDVIYTEEKAHDGAIWSMDIRRPTLQQPTPVLVTGSADKTVKFWDIEAQDNDDAPMVVHTRTLQMSDDVVAVRYSHSTDPSKRLVFVSILDSTIKVFFDDSLKFFLSLYGHQLPALAVDASDDDTILASSGADKTIKIWGLDFGDTHRTLYGHEDSITDLRFVRRTHNFFTASKDETIRYWDGDRFEQILILSGHVAEVNCLTVSRTGAFVLSGGMDRQIRVWERTKDIVFLDEERERELEKVFDRVNDVDEGGTAKILQRSNNNNNNNNIDDNDNDNDQDDDGNEPQSEVAVKRSMMSISAGDRIMESLERADQELKDIGHFKKLNKNKTRQPNLLMFGLDPPMYMLWVLKSIKFAELEQSLLVLPLGHVERLLYYLVLLLKRGRGIELCSRVAIFLVKIHQNQLLLNRSMAVPLRELRHLIRLRLEESRDMIGYNLAAFKMIAKVAQERKQSYLEYDDQPGKDIWAGLGLGSDVAAALQGSGRKNRR